MRLNLFPNSLKGLTVDTQRSSSAPEASRPTGSCDGRHHVHALSRVRAPLVVYPWPP